MSNQRKRIVLCRGVYCNSGRRADTLYPHIEALLDEFNGDEYPKRIKLETANCLSMCAVGPNVIIYPHNHVCNQLNVANIEAVLRPHLEDESP